MLPPEAGNARARPFAATIRPCRSSWMTPVPVRPVIGVVAPDAVTRGSSAA